jgi:hypothetical protein
MIYARSRRKIRTCKERMKRECSPCLFCLFSLLPWLRYSLFNYRWCRFSSRSYSSKQTEHSKANAIALPPETSRPWHIINKREHPARCDAMSPCLCDERDEVCRMNSRHVRISLQTRFGWSLAQFMYMYMKSEQWRDKKKSVSHSERDNVFTSIESVVEAVGYVLTSCLEVKVVYTHRLW